MAEERLLESVWIFLPDYRPGWSEIGKGPAPPRRWSNLCSVVIPLTLVSLVFLTAELDFPPRPFTSGHHGTYCLLFPAISLSRRIAGRLGAPLASAFSIIGLIWLSLAQVNGPPSTGWLVAMAFALLVVGAAAEIPPRRPTLSGRRPPNPAQHTLYQRKRRLIIQRGRADRFAFG
jgi:hypothetical protein